MMRIRTVSRWALLLTLMSGSTLSVQAMDRGDLSQQAPAGFSPADKEAAVEFLAAMNTIGKLKQDFNENVQQYHGAQRQELLALNVEFLEKSLAQLQQHKEGAKRYGVALGKPDWAPERLEAYVAGVPAVIAHVRAKKLELEQADNDQAAPGNPASPA